MTRSNPTHAHLYLQVLKTKKSLNWQSKYNGVLFKYVTFKLCHIAVLETIDNDGKKQKNYRLLDVIEIHAIPVCEHEVVRQNG